MKSDRNLIWEYKQVVCESAWHTGPAAKGRDEVLKQLGKEGWELVESKQATHSCWGDTELVFGIPCTILQLKRALDTSSPAR